MPYTRKAVEGAQCPHCGGQIYTSDRFISCENSGKEEGMCKFITGISLANGSEISEDDIRALCRCELVGPFLFHSDQKNKDYSASLQVDRDTGRVEKVFPSSNGSGSYAQSSETDYTCPSCGGKLVKRHGDYGEYLSCPNRDFRMSLSRGGHDFTDQEIRTILSGGETDVIEGLISQKGTTYPAKFRLDPDTLKLTPVFK